MNSSFLIVLAILTIFIVRGVVAEKKRAEEAQRKAAAQGAAGQRPVSPPARPSGSNAQPAGPSEWDAYGNPVRPPARPAAQRPTPSSPVRPAGSDTRPSGPAAPLFGSMTYASTEGTGSQEGTSTYASSNMTSAVFEHQPSAHHVRYPVNRANARQALIYSEILGKPKALRR